MSDYKRLTKQAGYHKDIDLKDELGYSYIYQRLAELENKIEQGTLKEFALRVGDFLYQPIKETGVIAEWQIFVIRVRIEEGIVYCDDCYQEWTDKDIGKTVFLTRKEAEKRLLELQGDKE